MSEHLIQVNNLRKFFSTGNGILYAVNDISFHVDAGETLGLVGESGCGKSTTGRAILRLQEPTAGEVLYKGENILKYGKAEMKRSRQNLQLVFQDPYSSQNPRMNVLKLIENSLEMTGVKDRNERLERVKDIMNVVGLEERLLDSYPHELDGGRRQRVGIARALILNPAFIVMDEPVSALDVCIQAQVLNLLRKLQQERGYSYLFISHNLSVVKHVSDRIAVMYLGKIVEVTDYKTLFKNPLHPYTKALLSAIPIPRVGENRDRIILKGDVPSPINPPPGCIFCGRCPYAKEICSEIMPSLKQVCDSKVACHLYE